MNDSSDYDYYAKRAEAERQLSADAADPVTAAIHVKLAERYERLMGEEGRDRPTLRIVTP